VEAEMKLLLATFLVAGALACATAETLPPDRLASSEGAIRAADELGAQSVPAAALHLRLAEDELSAAKAFADKGDLSRAELALVKSTADADLAVALVRADAARASADKSAAEMENLERSTR
jgi:hypothetical protein